MTTEDEIRKKAREVADNFDALHSKIYAACDGHTLETVGAVTAEMAVTAAVRLGMPKQVYLELVNRSWAMYGDPAKALTLH
jgi:hypothetical protein